MSDRETAIHNERVKLTATWLNGLAIATFALGALAPALTFFHGDRAMSAYLLGVIAICLVGSLALHLTGRFVLKGMRQ